MIRAAVITVSDKGARGEREDLSGPEVVRLLSSRGMEVVCTLVVPDEHEPIKAALIDCADRRQLDLIVTTGGTGVTPRDITPDATRAVLDREIPGMGEAMRQASMAVTPHAMISGTGGIRGRTLILIAGQPERGLKPFGRHAGAPSCRGKNQRQRRGLRDLKIPLQISALPDVSGNHIWDCIRTATALSGMSASLSGWRQVAWQFQAEGLLLSSIIGGGSLDLISRRSSLIVLFRWVIVRLRRKRSTIPMNPVKTTPIRKHINISM